MPYEWWYFDASFDNGYQAVAIIWPMNYSRPWRRQCTVQLSIYTPGGDNIKHYVFPPRSLFSASTERCDVRVGDSYMRGSHPGYEIRVEAGGDEVELVFEAETPGWKPGTGVNHVPVPGYDAMGWLVALPRARVHGRIRVRGRDIEVEGHGYHDHNWGSAPMFHLVDNWHWGHVVSGDLTIIWADITMSRYLRYDRTRMFLLGRGGRLVYESGDLSISYGDWSEEPLHLHPYPGTITVSFGDRSGPARGLFAMKVVDVVETQDLLDMTGIPEWLKRGVHRFMARPYYFRWRSSVEGSVTVEGEEIPVLGHTIHEQMLLRGRHPREQAAL